MLELQVRNIFIDIIGDLPSSQWKKLERRLSFRPQNYIFSTQYNRWITRNGKKIRMWDGWKRQFWRNSKRSYFPTGLLSLAKDFFEEEHISYKVKDLRVKPAPNISLTLSEELEKRDYQERVCNDACTRQRGIIHAATGCGKSAIAAAIIQKLGVSPFLFFVTSIDLLYQAKSELERFLRINGNPIKIGQVGGGIIDIQDINVLTVQTAVRALGRKWDMKTKFDSDDTKDDTPIEKRAKEILELLHEAKGSLSDECVAGNSVVTTKNGPVKIKDLNSFIGKEILSLSHNSAVWRKVTHFYPKGKKQTLTITLFNGDTITCTDDHPIMTKQGWKLARQLHHEDVILCCANVESNISQNACNINYVRIKSILKNSEEEVFDITVEDTHCFFANNILVHNCQHWRADTCQLITRELYNAYFTFGCSGTPYRDEGDDLMIQACFGKKIAEITASELIEKGWLMTPNIKIIHLKQPKSKYRQWQSIYKEQVVCNEKYNDIVANIANAYIDQNRLVLCLVQQINHGKYLESLIDGSFFLSGDSPKQKRIKMLDKLRNKDIRCIISTSLPFHELILVKKQGWIQQMEIGELCHSYEQEVRDGKFEILCSLDGKSYVWKRIQKTHIHLLQNNIVRIETERGEDVYVTENHSLVDSSLKEVMPKIGEKACVPQGIPKNKPIEEINIIELLSDIDDPTLEIEIHGLSSSSIKKMKFEYKYLSNIEKENPYTEAKKRLKEKSEQYKNSLFELFKYFRYYKFRYRAKLSDMKYCSFVFKEFKCSIYIRRSRKRFSLPVSIPITTDLAILSGLMCGDGHIKYHTKGKSCKSIYCFDFAAKKGNMIDGVNDHDKRDIRQIFQRTFKNVFGDCVFSKNDKIIKFRSKLIYYLFYKLGHINSNGEKRVPDYIYNSSSKIQESFLWGLYLSDGSKKINYRSKQHYWSGICIHNASRPLIIGIQAILQILRKSYYCRTHPTKHKRQYIITIRDPILHLKPNRQRDKFDYNSSERIQKKIDIVHGYNNKYVYDISVEDSHNFLGGSLLCHNSIFDEGINVRALDTLILAGQGKGKVRAMQRIGRTLRPYPNKPNPTVIDFRLYQKYLKIHSMEREKMFATEPKFNIEHIDPGIIS